MSFSRTKPAGWSTNAKFASAEANDIDIKTSQALDKTTAGDAIEGTVTFSGVGRLEANAAGTVRSTVAGGFRHHGGASDWVAFSANRTVPRISPLGDAIKLTSFSVDSKGWLFSTATGGGWTAYIRYAHDGATIASVTLSFKIPVGHGALPAVFPKLSIVRLDLLAGTVGVTLNSGDAGAGLAISSAANVAAYEAGGSTQTFVYTVNQNATVDHSKYVYLAVLTDESGANSVAGNNYFGLQPSFTVADMRFP